MGGQSMSSVETGWETVKQLRLDQEMDKWQACVNMGINTGVP
jgi:hypothetical protein